jgi:hypothetical protein
MNTGSWGETGVSRQGAEGTLWVGKFTLAPIRFIRATTVEIFVFLGEQFTTKNTRSTKKVRSSFAFSSGESPMVAASAALGESVSLRGEDSLSTESLRCGF